MKSTGVAATCIALCFAAAADLSAQAAPKPAPVAPAAPSAAELRTPPPSARKLPSGVTVQTLRPGSGSRTPEPQDLVLFRTIGRRVDGSVIQDGFAVKDPARASISRLNKGWQEGFVGMKVGEQRRFWFPAALKPKDPRSGVQEPVLFDIELLDIVTVAAPPASFRKPDPKSTRVGGASVMTTRAGKPGKAAVRTDAAMMNFTLWAGDGSLVSSSGVEGRSTLFPLEKVIPAFADCVVGMQLQEKRFCWIAAANNDGFPNATKGDLAFELELLQLIDGSKLNAPPAPASKP